MKRLLFILAAVFAGAPLAQAQTQTSVSATIVDPNGIHYSGGTVKFDLSPSTVQSPTVNKQPVFSQGPVSVDPNGHFTIGLWANSAISPGGTQWTVTVYNPGAPPPVGFGPVSFSVTLTISGSSQDISSALNAAALPLLAVGTASTSVTSFNGRMGAVVSQTGDYSFTQISGSLLHSQLPTLLSADIPNNAANTSGNAATATAFAATPTLCSGGTPFAAGILANGNATGCAAAGGVTSFNTRTGAVLPVTNDYSFSQISGALLHSQLPTLLSADIPNNAANTSGNSATATALAAPPSLCSSGQAPTGILASGNATGCATAGGNLTAKYITGDSTQGTLINSLPWPSLYNGPDAPPITRNAMDDEFDGASLNSPNNIWTWLNQGTATEIQAFGAATISGLTSNGSTHVVRAITQALPSPPYTFVCKALFHSNTAFSDYTFGGMYLYESATGKYMFIGWNPTGSAPHLQVQSATATAFTGPATGQWTVAYLKINRTGTSLTYYFSTNGITYDLVATRALTTDFTTAPDTIGLGVDPYSQIAILDVEWFRRTL